MEKSLESVSALNEEQRIAINKPLVKMIKFALCGFINYPKGKDCNSVSYSYLLNQCIRQYVLPQANIHISIGASRLWSELFAGSLEQSAMLLYTYQDKIRPFNSVSQVETYSGTNKTIIKVDVKGGEKIPFNSIFIDEHTTPVADVVKALIQKKSPVSDLINEDEIVELLDKIHITKMCKYENAKIKLNNQRIAPMDYLQLGVSDIFDKITQDERVGYPKIL